MTKERKPNLLAKLKSKGALGLIARALDTLDWLHTKLSVFYFFKLIGLPKVRLRHRFSGEIRWANEADIPGLIQCYGKDHSRLYKKRFENHELCLIAIDKHGNTAGFGWISRASEHRENKSKCIIKIPQGTLYTYNWFIAPEHRFTGLWVGLMNCLIDSKYYDPAQGIITFIAQNNTASFKTHIRFGFELYLRRIVLTLFNWPVSINRAYEHNDENIRQLIEGGA